MDRVNNSGDQPVFETDQGTDGQESFDTWRAGDRRHLAAFQLADKDGKLNTDQHHGREKQVLDNFTIQLDVGRFQLFDKGAGFLLVIGAGNHGDDFSRTQRGDL